MDSLKILIPITLIIVLITIVYNSLKHYYSYWARQNVLHEKPKFFVGNMSGLGRQYTWRDINRRIYDRFKGKAPFVGYYQFFKRDILILDLDLIQNILIKNFNSFPNRGLFHNTRDDPLTGNLLFLDGEPWRALRHKLSPVFTTGKLRYMFAIMTAIGDRLIDACSKELNNKNVIEVKDLCARFTTDMIGECAFGISCNCLHDPNAEFRLMGRKVFEQPRHSLFVQAFMFSNPDLARKLRMKNFHDNISEFFMNAVRETVDYRIKNDVKRNDLMDMLVDLKILRDKIDESTERSELDNLSNGLTIEQIAAQAMVFFLAGFDTSSTTMSYCLYEMALNPKVQEKLREEICKVLDNHNDQLTYENIKEMIYLEKVICETLRKHSVLPHIIRVCTADYKVPNTNWTITNGVKIVMPIDCIHNDSDLYPEPEKFDPERFSAEEIEKRHPMAFLPFGDGPRNCIGNRFGKLQAKIGIITLLRHFRFTVVEQTKIPMPTSKQSFLLAPEGGIFLGVSKLQRSK